jgi:caffeoyl-CoA O-methyltransferase
VITPDDVERYCAEHTTAPGPWMEALEAETRAELSSPQMLTGRLEGRFLETLVWATGARRVLEIGTFSGYGALSLAGGLPPDGKVWTCELSEERAAFARRHIAASPLAERIEVVVGPALESVRSLPGPWDLVFIDADKTGYPDYVEAVRDRLAPRGLVLLDNTLRGGDVVDPGSDPDESTRVTAALNDRLATDPDWVVTLLPVRDGVTLLRRAG